MSFLNLYQAVKKLESQVSYIMARLNKISQPDGKVRFGDDPIVGLLPPHGHTGTSTGGTIDHGVTTGLGDDDHPQYLTPAEHTAIGDGAPHHARYTDAEARAAAVSDVPYGSGWNGITDVAPSKNAVYDKIQSLVVGGGYGYEPLTNGVVENPELIFADGDVIMVRMV